MWRGKSRSGISIMWDEMISTDLSKQVLSLTCPFISLKVSTITPAPTQRQRSILNNSGAIKGFYTFEQSAHSPLLKNLKKWTYFAEDVLAGTNSLADAK